MSNVWMAYGQQLFRMGLGLVTFQPQKFVCKKAIGTNVSVQDRTTNQLPKLTLLFIDVVRELSHAAPDMSIHGSLSSVHCSLDLEHYHLIRGLLENNLGEPVEDFLRPYNLQDPSTYVRKQATTCALTNQLNSLLQSVLHIYEHTNTTLGCIISFKYG